MTDAELRAENDALRAELARLTTRCPVCRRVLLRTERDGGGTRYWHDDEWSPGDIGCWAPTHLVFPTLPS